jgi:hypothetical protein
MTRTQKHERLRRGGKVAGLELLSDRRQAGLGQCKYLVYGRFRQRTAHLFQSALTMEGILREVVPLLAA